MHELYRMFDANGNLLYVGISICSVARLGQHRADWLSEVSDVKIERHKTAHKAARAERLAIANETPVHNKCRPKDWASQTRSRSKEPLTEHIDNGLCAIWHTKQLSRQGKELYARLVAHRDVSANEMKERYAARDPVGRYVDWLTDLLAAIGGKWNKGRLNYRFGNPSNPK